jgi:hypothetical protein
LTDGAVSVQSDAELDAAYRSAIYRVLDTERFDLAIGQFSARLADWHSRHGVRHSDLITAFNPGSQSCLDAENQNRTECLRARLPADRLMATVAIDPAGGWPDEAGFLVGGMDREAVLALMIGFGQNAWVHAGPDAIPRLEWVVRKGDGRSD